MLDITTLAAWGEFIGGRRESAKMEASSKETPMQGIVMLMVTRACLTLATTAHAQTNPNPFRLVGFSTDELTGDSGVLWKSRLCFADFGDLRASLR